MEDLFITPEDYNNPEWEKTSRVHEWKNYITEEVKTMWPAFTEEQRRAIARQADATAAAEYWD